MGVYDELEKCVGFGWDDGNRGKTWEKHLVADGEAEEVVFNEPLIGGADVAHSGKERRYFALGQSDGRRPLFVVFAIREKLIRVISTREMTKRELRRYRS